MTGFGRVTPYSASNGSEVQLVAEGASVAQSQYQISPVDPVPVSAWKIRCRQNFPGSLIPKQARERVSPAKCSPGSFLISATTSCANAVQNRSPAPDKENHRRYNFEQHRLHTSGLHRCCRNFPPLSRVNTVMTSVPCATASETGDKGFAPDAPDAPTADRRGADPRLFVIHRHNAAVAQCQKFSASHGLRPNCLVIRYSSMPKVAPSQSAAYRFPVSDPHRSPAVRGDLALLPQT